MNFWHFITCGVSLKTQWKGASVMTFFDADLHDLLLLEWREGKTMQKKLQSGLNPNLLATNLQSFQCINNVK